MLLTRPPLNRYQFHPKTSFVTLPLDLHVLGTPPAFILSQDQTLKLLVDSWFRLLAWLIISNLHYFGFVLNSSQTQGQTRPCFLNFQGLCIVQSLIFMVRFVASLLLPAHAFCFLFRKQLGYNSISFQACQQLFLFFCILFCFPKVFYFLQQVFPWLFREFLAPHQRCEVYIITPL